MYKRGNRCLLDRRAQITIFMIIGLIILFVAVFVIQAARTIERGELEQSQEDVLTNTFNRQAMKLYIDTCLRDELENGLILIGKQGRIWSDQPGGRKDFVEGETGVLALIDGSQERVAYGITYENQTPENQYPCDESSLAPEFCQYKYPDTTISFGEHVLRKTTIEGDLERYLRNKTIDCSLEYISTNVSEFANIISSEVELNVRLHDEGISVEGDYPLRFEVGSKEFFERAVFDFFYQTKFKSLVETALEAPLRWDTQYIDFNYTTDTLETGSFQYGSEKEIFRGSTSLCVPGSPFICNRALAKDTYNALGIDMTVSNFGADTIYTFHPSSPILETPTSYSFSIARQNRPPALSYISRSECVVNNYDYLVVQNHTGTLGFVNITPLIHDPDEDDVTYEFTPHGILYNQDSSGESFFLEFFTRGRHNLTVRTYDEHGFSDWQEVRILVDRPQEVGISLFSPYVFQVGDSFVTYEDLFSGDRFFVSNEDPVFLKYFLPDFSESDLAPSISLSYSSPTENFPLRLEYSATSNKEGCINLPTDEGVVSSCDLSSYTADDLVEWPVKLQQFDVPHFRDLGEGILDINFSMNYCSDQDLTTHHTIDVTVAECIPHKNPKHPFAYPYHEYSFSSYDFINDSGNFTGLEEINPFEATHACCLGDPLNPPSWHIAMEGEVDCFINPELGCYGEIIGHTRGSSTEGYVLEEEYATCTGDRGNLCGGKRYRLAQDSLVCGNNSLSSCSGIPTACENKPAFSYVDTDDDNQNDAWCSGTMGCEEICRDAVSYIGPLLNPDFPVSEMNRLAKNLSITHHDEFDFRCGCMEGTACDVNFNGNFAGTCTSGQCVGDV